MEDFVGALLAFFAGDFAIQWICCIFSAILQTEIFFDLVGSSTFILGALASLAVGGVFHQRQVLATTLVCVWGLRLGTFLFMRILQTGRDSRFNGVRDAPLLLFAYWTIQGLWVFFVLAPVVALNVSQGNKDWWQPTDALGLLLWSVGFLVEVVADYQKFFFRMDDANKDKWVSSGLWSLCRHPNYSGEMVLWWGMFFLCWGGLPTLTLKALSLISPVFICWMLTTVSGAPLLERAARRKWGAMPEYQAYVEHTPPFLPYIPGVRKKAD